MAEPLPPDVKRLLREQVRSFEELEVLRVLWSSAERVWTRREVADSVEIPDGLVDRALRSLCESGIVLSKLGADGRLYAYRPETVALVQTLSKLMRAYERQRSDILGLLASNALRRLRDGMSRWLAGPGTLGGRTAHAEPKQRSSDAANERYRR